MSDRSDAVLDLAAGDTDRWGDLIDWLVDPEGTESFLPADRLDDPFYVALRALDENDLRDVRLAAEICPVHHVDAAICADDEVGDGSAFCGDRAVAIVRRRLAAAEESHTRYSSSYTSGAVRSLRATLTEIEAS